MSATTTQAADHAAPVACERGPAVRFVKRGPFRRPEPVPDHIQAAWGGLPVHGLPATTVRELLHHMAHGMVSMDYKRRHTPDTPIGEACLPWLASYAAQAKALLWAARLGEDSRLTEGPDFPIDMPVPQPIKVSAEDCRARFLDLYGEGALTAELTYRYPSSAEPSTQEGIERREAMSKAAYRLYEDMIRAGIVRDAQDAAT